MPVSPGEEQEEARVSAEGAAVVVVAGEASAEAEEDLGAVVSAREAAGPGHR